MGQENVLLIDENFNSGGLPTGWDANDGDILWNFSNVDTPTFNTGITGISNGRAYVESSGTVAGQEAWLITNEIDLMNDAIALTLTFDAGLYGSTMGTLYVDIYDVDQDSYTNNVFSIGGDQGDGWVSASVDLSAFTDKIRIRFRASIGDVTYSDFELDNIQLIKTQHDDLDDIIIDRTTRCTIPENKQYPDDIYWPLINGDTHICLWRGDKKAAFSFTIDDNWEENQSWWDGLVATYGRAFTWMVVTGWIGDIEYMGQSGDWPGYKSLFDNGHAIESHSVSHTPINSTNFTAQEIIDEFQDSRDALNTNVAGNDVKTFAYPMGDNSESSVAAEHYIATRGTDGGFNTPWPSMYNVKNVESINFDTPGMPSTYVDSLTDDSSIFYRGWAVYLFHKMETADRTAMTGLLDYLQTNDADYWVSTFPKVSEYIHARNSASISGSTANNVITVNTNTDLSGLHANVRGMVEEPLTYKTKIPLSWCNVAVQHNGQSIDTTTVTNENGVFLLYDIIPDGNNVTITNSAEQQESPAQSSGGTKIADVVVPNIFSK